MDVDDVIKYVDELRATDREALRIAKSETDRRLLDMNELRHQIDRERNQYLTVDQYEVRHRALIARQETDNKEHDRRLVVLEKHHIGDVAVAERVTAARNIRVLQTGMIVTLAGIFVQILMKVFNVG